MHIKIYNKYGVIKDEDDNYLDFSTSLFNAEKIFLKHYIIVRNNLKRSKSKYIQTLFLRSKSRKNLFNTTEIDNVVTIIIEKSKKFKINF